MREPQVACWDRQGEIMLAVATGEGRVHDERDQGEGDRRGQRPENAVGHAVGDAVGRAVRHAVRDAIRHAVRDAIRHAVRGSIGENRVGGTEEEAQAVDESHRPGGNPDQAGEAVVGPVSADEGPDHDWPPTSSMNISSSATLRQCTEARSSSRASIDWAVPGSHPKTA